MMYHVNDVIAVRKYWYASVFYLLNKTLYYDCRQWLLLEEADVCVHWSGTTAGWQQVFLWHVSEPCGGWAVPPLPGTPQHSDPTPQEILHQLWVYTDLVRDLC